jgi:hypothetical protein
MLELYLIFEYTLILWSSIFLGKFSPLGDPKKTKSNAKIQIVDEHAVGNYLEKHLELVHNQLRKKLSQVLRPSPCVHLTQ